MSIVRKFVNNFTTGVISPGVQQRLDLQKYAAACRRIENAVVQPHGGVAKRHGLQLMGKVYGGGFLVPFQYNVAQSAVLLFTDQRLSVYVGGELSAVLGPSSVPYLLEDLPGLRFCQSADVMFLTHPSYVPRKLMRSMSGDEVTWTMETMSFGVSISPPQSLNAGDGDSSSTVVPQNSSIASKTLYYKVAAMTENGEESEPSDEESFVVRANWNAGGFVRLTWSAPETGAVTKYVVYKRIRGQYGLIGYTTSRSFDDDNIEPDTSVAPKTDYLPFDSEDSGDNLPGAVGIYQQRLVFARTDLQPQTVWMSETGAWNSFGKHEPLIDSDSIEVTVDSRQMNEIRHFALLRDGVVFTAGAEYIMSPGRNNDAVTPTSIRFDLQSYWGCSEVPPLVIGQSILFIQRNGHGIRNLMYRFSEDGYAGEDMTVMANHLFTSPVRDWAYQQSPNGCVWVVLEDGRLLSFTYMPEQEVYAWATHSTEGGSFRSVTVIREADRDMAYFLVERDGEFFLERMEAEWDYGDASEDAVFLDMSEFFEASGDAVDAIEDIRLGALAGGTFDALIDGSRFGGIEVTAASFPCRFDYDTGSGIDLKARFKSANGFSMYVTGGHWVIAKFGNVIFTSADAAVAGVYPSGGSFFTTVTDGPTPAPTGVVQSEDTVEPSYDDGYGAAYDVVTTSTSYSAYNGRYYRINGKVCNGKPVFKHASDTRYFYFYSGYWRLYTSYGNKTGSVRKSAAGDAEIAGAWTGSVTVTLCQGNVPESITVTGSGDTQMNSGGSCTLPVAGRKIIIGLPYKMTVETVDPEISSQDGSVIADKRSVAEVAVAVRETADLKIGYDEQHLETLKFPYPANLGDAPVLYTGYLKAPLAGSYRPTASMVMTSDSPLPCTILSVMSKISIG